MTDLTGKRYLVAGGTGDVGSAIVGVLLSRGAQVLVPARDAVKAERLRAEVGSERLTIIAGNVATVAGAESVAAQIETPLSGVVASLGGWWQGPPLTAVSPFDWDAILAGNLTSHFAAARAFVPLIDARGGGYVQILGAAAEYPIPGSSLVSVTASAVAMMGRLMLAENADAHVAFRQVMIASIVATRARTEADPSWVTAEEVGAVVADILNMPDLTPAVTRIEQHHTA